MKSDIISTTADSISSGGTVSGDLKIEGDLEVEGGGSLTVDAATSGNVSIIDTTSYSATEGGNLIIGANNTSDGALDSGDRLGVLSFVGAEDGSSTLTTGARIEAIADANWSATENGADLLFYTTDGNLVETEQLRITADGKVSIGGDAAPKGILHIEAPDDDGIFIITAGASTKAVIEFQENNSATYGCQFGFEGAGTEHAFISTMAGGSAITRIAVTRDSGNVGIGIHTPATVLDVSPIQYSTGTASQSGTTVTGSGTTWTSAMIGQQFLYADGTSSSLITARASNTSITVTTSQTVSSQAYSIHYNVMKLDGNSRISLSNNDSGTSNTIFGKNAGLAGLSGGTHNVLIGEDAGNDMTTADHNVAIGTYAMDKVTISCDGNVAIGYDAMSGVVTDNTDNCVFIGKSTCQGLIEGVASGSIGIGFQALKSVVTGIENVAIGYKGAELITTGGSNVALGFEAMVATPVAATSNVAIGTSAMGGAASGNTASNYNIAIGHDVMVSGSLSAANFNTGIGYVALNGLSTGDSNTAIGKDAGKALTTVSECVFIGEAAGSGVTTGNTSDGTIAIGYGALTGASIGTGNLAIGRSALSGASAAGLHRNTVIGYLAASNVGSQAPTDNTILGSSAALALTTASQNVVIGSAAFTEHTTGASNTVIGYGAMNATQAGGTQSTSAGSEHNVFVGKDAGGGTWANQNNSNCVGIGSGVMIGALEGDTVDGTVAIGKSALAALTSGTKNIAIGYNAMLLNIEGDKNIAIGYAAMDAMVGQTGETNVGDSNIAIGADAMGSVNAGTHATANSDSNIAIGTNALLGGDFGSNDRELIGNIAIGFGALSATGTNAQTGTVGIGHAALNVLTSGVQNTAIGYQAGLGMTTASNNTILGYKALDAATTQADGNTAIGSYAMGGSIGTEDVNNCVAIGYEALDANLEEEAAGAVAIGKSALGALTSGAANTAVGYAALDAITSSSNNTAVGYNALTACGDSYSNVAIGKDAGDLIANSGGLNTVIGTGADVSISAAENQIAIGNGATGLANNSVTLGNSSITDVYMSQDSGAKVHCGGIVGGRDELTATNSGVAASLLDINTEVTTNGDGDLDNVTLANGVAGQIKNIYCTVEGAGGDTWKITPATMCGGTQITFAGVGLGCTMVYADSEGWVVVGNNGGTIS